jgi:hypothetical protein
VVITAVQMTLHSRASMNVCPVFDASNLFLERKKNLYRDDHKHILSDSEFHKNLCKQGYTMLGHINAITFIHVP